MKYMGKVFRTLLFMMAHRMDDLLVTYERSTPCIDQTVVNRTLGTIQLARRIAATLVVILALGGATAHAFETRENPDKVPSFGLDLWKGQLAGIDRELATTNGGTVGGLFDYRHPVTNALTLHAFVESEGVNNNLRYSDGYRVGFGMRVYLQDR